MRKFIVLMIAVALGGGVGFGMASWEVGPSFPLDASDLTEQPEESSTVAEHAPRVLVDSKEYDFGRMQRGTKQSHTFRVTNVGNAPLALQLGRASCKCTVGELSKDTLAPGESVEVPVEWKAQVGAGEFRQWVPLTTNDPSSPHLEFTIYGEVTEPTGLFPRMFSFGSLPFGETREEEMVLVSYLKDEVEIESAEIPGDTGEEFFEFEIEEVSKTDLPDPKAIAGKKIRLRATGKLPVGVFTQWLSVKTNLEEMPTLDIPIDGRVVGDIAIHGRGWNEEQGVLRLGRVISDKGKKANLNIVLRGKESRDIEVEVVEVEPEEIEVSVGEPRRLSDTIRHIPLKIEVPAGTRPLVRLGTDQHDAGRVVLATTHPQASRLEIEVRFAVER